MDKFQQEMLNKIESGQELSEPELEELTFEYSTEDIEGDELRWQRAITSIIQFGDKYFAIEWLKGLTECQESYYLEQPYEVKPVEKTIVVKEWVKV